jgi:hypothetical protein
MKASFVDAIKVHFLVIHKSNYFYELGSLKLSYLREGNLRLQEIEYRWRIPPVSKKEKILINLYFD